MGLLLFQILRAFGGMFSHARLCALFVPSAGRILAFPVQTQSAGAFSSSVRNGLAAGTNPERVAITASTTDSRKQQSERRHRTEVCAQLRNLTVPMIN